MTHHLDVPHISAAMHECIDNCSDCLDVCTATLTYCVARGGHHVEPGHVAAMRDCAAACEASLGFMLRGSDLHPRYCDACAEACERCAESCERMADDDVMRRCAASCRAMAAH